MRYRVVSHMTELNKGAPFITIAGHPVGTGELALFSVGDRFGDKLIVGRWYPGIAGYDWIAQPNRLIRITKDVIIWIIGRIIPLTLNIPCLN